MKPSTETTIVEQARELVQLKRALFELSRRHNQKLAAQRHEIERLTSALQRRNAILKGLRIKRDGKPFLDAKPHSVYTPREYEIGGGSVDSTETEENTNQTETLNETWQFGGEMFRPVKCPVCGWPVRAAEVGVVPFYDRNQTGVIETSGFQCTNCRHTWAMSVFCYFNESWPYLGVKVEGEGQTP